MQVIITFRDNLYKIKSTINIILNDNNLLRSLIYYGYEYTQYSTIVNIIQLKYYDYFVVLAADIVIRLSDIVIRINVTMIYLIKHNNKLLVVIRIMFDIYRMYIIRSLSKLFDKKKNHQEICSKYTNVVFAFSLKANRLDLTETYTVSLYFMVYFQTYHFNCRVVFHCVIFFLLFITHVE